MCELCKDKNCENCNNDVKNCSYCKNKFALIKHENEYVWEQCQIDNCDFFSMLFDQIISEILNLWFFSILFDQIISEYLFNYKRWYLNNYQLKYKTVIEIKIYIYV